MAPPAMYMYIKTVRFATPANSIRDPALQEKYGYPMLFGLEKRGINSQKLPLNPV